MLGKSQITLVRSLRNKADRTTNNLFVAEGDKLIAELIPAGLTIRTIYHTPQSTLTPIGGCVEVTPADMARLSQLKTPTPSLALVEIPPAANESADQGLVLVLDGVQDPGNIGTIIRVADWFGIRRVICSPDCADCYASKTVQATMGAIARVSVVYADLCDHLSQADDRPIYGTFLTDSQDIYSIDPLDEHAYLVMGSEGRGISPAVERLVTDRLFIPPFPAAAPTVESLNVAVATAVAVAELRRCQR